MITQINSDIELLDLLKESERTGETQTMRSFLLFWNQYPIRSNYVINEWIGFKTHHESKKQPKINKRAKEHPDWYTKKIYGMLK